MKKEIKKIFKDYSNKKYPYPVSPCCDEEIRGIKIKKEFYIGCPKCKQIWILKKGEFYRVNSIKKL